MLFLLMCFVCNGVCLSCPLHLFCPVHEPEQFAVAWQNWNLICGSRFPLIHFELDSSRLRWLELNTVSYRWSKIGFLCVNDTWDWPNHTINKCRKHRTKQFRRFGAMDTQNIPGANSKFHRCWICGAPLWSLLTRIPENTSWRRLYMGCSIKFVP